MKHRFAPWLSVFLVFMLVLSNIPLSVVHGQDAPHMTQLANSSFEIWELGLPVDWYGNISNIGAANVIQTGSAADGASAVQLVNTGGTGLRFTSKGYQVYQGTEYTLSYWVKGSGQIWTRYHDGTYRNTVGTGGTTYATIDTNEWTNIVVTFTAVNTHAATELIFMVRSTEDLGGHIQIDNVSIAGEEPAVPDDPDEPDDKVYVNNLINGDFEEWVSGDPVAWKGALTNFTTISQYTESAKTGLSAVQLVRTGTTHGRFTTQPYSIEANTEYTVTYWVRGQGDIRNAFYRAANYSGYSAYTAVDSGDWQKITWTFQYGTAVDDVEIIFSVRSTNAARDHLQIDNVSVYKTVSATPIADARVLSAGTVTTVEGTVTGVLGTGRNIFFQDDTAGLVARLGTGWSAGLQPGDKIRVTGAMGAYANLVQIEPASLEGYEILERAAGLPAPVTATLAELPALQGQLVTAQGLEVISVGTGTNYNVTVEDALGNRELLRVENTVDKAYFEVGKVLDVTAPVGQFNADMQLMVRGLDDVPEADAGERVAPVIATPAAGQVEPGTEVSLATTTPDAVIYYTTDGSNPTQASLVYSGPIVITAATTIKAYAVLEGFADSIISTYAYSIPQMLTITEAKQTAGIVTVQGIVTAVHGLHEIYIQDSTSGIQVYRSNINTKVSVGDLVEITGSMGAYKGELQLAPASLDDVEVLSSDNELPQRLEVSLKHAGQTNGWIDVGAALTAYTNNNNKTIVVRGVITNVLPNGEYALQIADRLDPSQTMSVQLPAGYREEFNPQLNPAAVGRMIIVMGQEKDYFSTPAIQMVSVWDGTSNNPIGYYLNHDIEGMRIQTKYPFEVTGKDTYGFYARDEEGDVYIYTGRSTNFNLANIQVGDWYTAAGITGYYDRPQVKLADGGDLEMAVPPGQQDPREPMVLDPKPAPFSSVYNRTPVISVRLEESDLTNTAINYAGIEMFLNGTQVTPVIDQAGNFVSYQVASALGYGDQEVLVRVPDVDGLVKEFSWFFTVVKEEVQYNFYFGVPHSHTAYSDGAGTPTQAFEHARGNGLQFHIVTDHSNWYDGVSQGNFEFDAGRNEYVERLNPSTGQMSEWWKTRVEAEAINDLYSDFLALRGFEMTSSIWGHMNTINSETYVEAKKQMVPLRDYYEWMVDVSTRPGANVYNMFNHPNWPNDSFADLAYVSRLDRYINGIEVANGAPPYSYSRAEGHYWKALDNGWRLGALNSQDNHAENWGDVDNLTVVIAEDLSTDSLIDAMNARRTYSTETRTLELTVKGNGYWMGSVLDVAGGETIDFEIIANDSVVPIQKLQLITNGGWVADEITFGAGTNTAAWTPSVVAMGGAEWFVVKVIHADNSWGHASPIFTSSGENDLKLTALHISPNPTLPGLETELEAAATNMGIRHIDGEVEVKFYLNDPTDEGNLIASVIHAERIPAGAVVSFKTVWTPPLIDGQHRIYAVMTEIEGVTTVTELSSLVDIVKPIGKKIMVDGAHSNSEVPGTTTEIIEMLRLYGYEASIFDSGTITAALLADVDVLIINTPLNISSYYTAAEEQAIAQWVNAGGSVMVANKSNFSHDPRMLNSLMAQMGSTIRFNNDNVYEPTGSGYYDGGMEWSVNAYNLPATESGLNANMLAIRMFSSCSLTTVDGDGNAAPLVNNPATGLEILLGGNATSYNALPGVDAWIYNTNGGLNGESIPMIAQELVGDGKLIAAGRYFYSDFEIGNNVSNTALTLQVIDWLAGYQREQTIAHVRENANEGDIVSVRGTVTAPSDHFFDVIYIQDETSGVAVYGTQTRNNLPVGTEVLVTGKVLYFEGELEIDFMDYDFQVLFVGPVDYVEPLELATVETMLPDYTGMLVTTQGFITEFNQAQSYFLVNDGSGVAHVHVDGYVGADMSRFQVGDYVQVTGNASLGSVGPRIRVRFYEDLELLETPDMGDYPLGLVELVLPAAVSEHVIRLIPAVVQIKAAAGEDFVFIHGNLRLTIPAAIWAGIIDGSEAELIVAISQGVSHPAPAGRQIVDGYSLELHLDGVPATGFAGDMTITFSFGDVGEPTITWYNGVEWVVLDATIAGNSISTLVNHWSEFALMDAADGGGLPATGTNVYWYLPLGLVLLGVGAFIVLRQRKQA